MADDYRSDISTTGMLAVGASVKGNFESTADADWFKINLLAGTTYLFGLSGAAQGGGTVTDFHRASVDIMNVSGQMVATSYTQDRAAPGPIGQFTPASSGVYYVAAQAGYGSAIGSYTLSALVAEKDDYASNISTTGVLQIGSSVKGNFETAPDSDWFKINLQAGSTYVFGLSGAAQGGGTVNDFHVTTVDFMNANGEMLAASITPERAAPGPVGQFTPAYSGIYYVDVQSGYGPARGSYTLSAALAEKDDFAPDISTTGVLQAGVAVQGKFERLNDNDWFRFHADQGQQFNFSILTYAGAAASTFAVYDAAGRYVSAPGQGLFVAPSSGDFYLGLSGKNELGITYSATMKLLPDEYSSDDSSPGRLTAGSQLTGALQFQGDKDRIKIDMVAGQIYTIQLSTAAGSDASLVQLSFIDSTGAAVSAAATDNVIAGGTRTVTFAAAKTGSYSLDLSSDQSGDTSIPYTLKVLAPEVDDYGNTIATSATLALGAAVSGRLSLSTDIDMFKVTLAAGVTYRFELTQESGSVAYGGIELYDASGVAVSTPSYGAEKVISYTPTINGEYYLSTSSLYYSSIKNLNYVLKADLVDDDYGASAAIAGKLTVGSSLNGSLSPGGGDRDWFAVSLDAGATYWFTLTGAKEGDGTLPLSFNSTQLRLVDAKGAVLASAGADNNGAGPVLPYVPTVKETYYVEVAVPGSAGSYKIKAELGQPDDYGNDTAHAAAISNGVTVKGSLELPSDKDVFKLHAVAGTTYALEMTQAQGGSTSLWAYYMSLSVSTNSQSYVPVRSAPSDSSKLYQLFDATETGDYYFTVSNYKGVTAYVLTATAQPADDYPATNKTTGVLDAATPLHGTIGMPGDRDWVKVHLEAGRTYVFDLQGAASGGGTLPTSDLSSGLTLYNSSGSPSAQSASYDATGATAEARIYYIAANTGDYYLDAHGNGSKTGTYTLNMTQTSGDVSAPLLTGAWLASGTAGFAPSGKIVLTFNEPVMVGTGITLTNSYGVAVQTVSGQPLAKAVGSTLVIDPHFSLAQGSSYTLALPDGGVLDLAGNHLAGGARSYSFTVAKPVATGGNGNDFLIGSGKGLALNGGAGIDTAYYDDSQDALQVTRSAGQIMVKAAGAAAGDTLTDVERLLFPTHALALDIAGNGGQTYRLYQAAFNRVPDSSGLGFWIAAMDNKTSLHTVAQGFVDSAEFKTLYGAAPSDAEFVKLLYNNVLHRAPDQAGTDFWVQGLHDGASRADILANFSESPENQAALLSVIGNGFAYTPYG
jgi:hypothetical protein